MPLLPLRLIPHLAASLLLPLCCSLFASTARAQQAISTDNSLLTVKEHNISPEFVKIQYKIPYGGMVEIRLYKKEQMIWRDQYIRRDGDHQIRLNAGRLPAGEYAYTLTYKGRRTRKTFSVQGDPNGGKAQPPQDQPQPATPDTPEPTPEADQDPEQPADQADEEMDWQDEFDFGSPPGGGDEGDNGDSPFD